MTAKAEIGPVDPDGRKPKGLEDRGHIILECADCGIPLLDLWITADKEGIGARVQVQCGVCGGESYIRKVEGLFHTGAPEGMAFDLVTAENDLMTFRAWRRGTDVPRPERQQD